MNQKYKILLFDLDGTLINNKESIRHAFKSILKNLNIKYNNKIFEDFYAFDFIYWHNLPEVPLIIKNKEEKSLYYKVNFFIEFFKDKNLSFEEGLLIEEKYYNVLGRKVLINDNAYNTIKSLNNNYKIIIATNGEKNSAKRKVISAGLDKYVHNIISSEDCGYSKPDKNFFSFILDNENGISNREVLMIGDTILTDIKGGIDSNIDTCWYNEQKNKNEFNYEPTYEINDLSELIQIL